MRLIDRRVGALPRENLGELLSEMPLRRPPTFDKKLFDLTRVELLQMDKSILCRCLFWMVVGVRPKLPLVDRTLDLSSVTILVTYIKKSTWFYCP
jgi:hypothetical protein